MIYINEYVERVYKTHKKDWDTVICITGKNRKGKTNLGLHMVHKWLELQGKTVEEKHAYDHIALDAVGFSKVLMNAKKGDVVMDDEAGEISNRSFMSKLNKKFVEAYQVIAEENFFTILILPEIFYLDGYFVKDRIKHLFHVYERGRVSFWSNKRLNHIIDFNQNWKVKNLYYVLPNFRDTFPIYNGALKSAWQEMKKEKMKTVRSNLFNELSSDNGVTAPKRGRPTEIDADTRKIIVKKLHAEGMSDEKIALELGFSTGYVKNIRRAINIENMASRLNLNTE